jgi:hypothetical protein
MMCQAFYSRESTLSSQEDSCPTKAEPWTQIFALGPPEYRYLQYRKDRTMAALKLDAIFHLLLRNIAPQAITTMAPRTPCAHQIVEMSSTALSN